MSDCIFCKIAAGEIPSETVYEDEFFRAIYDISPVADGHTLILPKGHYADVFALPGEVAARVVPAVKTVAEILKEKFGADGFNVLQNNGAAAGQTVPHYHVHVVPRYSGRKIKTTEFLGG